MQQTLFNQDQLALRISFSSLLLNVIKTEEEEEEEEEEDVIDSHD